MRITPTENILGTWEPKNAEYDDSNSKTSS